MYLAKKLRASALTFLFLFISLISVSALSIDTPDITTYTEKQQIKLIYQVYDNGTLYYEAGPDLPTCNFFLYDFRGINISTVSPTISNFNYEVDLTSQALSGDYYYRISCNNSLGATITSDSFKVTPRGKETNQVLEWSIIGGFLIIVWLFMYLINRFKEDIHAVVVYGIVGGTVCLLITYWLASYWGMLTDTLFQYSVIALGISLTVYFYVVFRSFDRERLSQIK